MLLCLASLQVRAADYAPIHLGAIEFTPDFNTGVTPMGSVLLPNGEEESAELLLFKPRISAFFAGKGRQLSSTVEVHNGIYSAVGDAAYVDWKVENIARFEFAGNRSIRFHTETFHTHEGAGSAVVPDDEQAPARFVASTFDTSFEQSLWGARGHLVLDTGTFAKEFLDAARRPELRNHGNRHIGSSFRYHFLPGAQLQLQYRTRDIDYGGQPLHDGVGSAPVRQETFSYVGASWKPATVLAGKLKIASGYRQTANRTAAASADTSTWEANVHWQPFDASTLTFAADLTSRRFTGAVSSDSTSNFRYNWEQRWGSQLKTTVAGSYSHEVATTTSGGKEGIGFKFRLDYARFAWLDMFLAFGHDHHSSGGVLDFSQQTLRLGIAASFFRGALGR